MIELLGFLRDPSGRRDRRVPAMIALAFLASPPRSAPHPPRWRGGSAPRPGYGVGLVRAVNIDIQHGTSDSRSMMLLARPAAHAPQALFREARLRRRRRWIAGIAAFAAAAAITVGAVTWSHPAARLRAAQSGLW